LQENLRTYGNSGVKAVYFTAISLTILINTLDIFWLTEAVPVKVLLNCTTIIVLLTSLILLLLKVLNYDKSYIILAYTIIISTILDFYLYLHHTEFMPVLMRDSFFLLCVISISAFALNRNHAVIFSFLFLSNLIALTFISHEPFLLINLPGLGVVIIFYSLTMYFYLKVRDRHVYFIEQSNKMIKDQSKEIYLQNTELLQKTEEISSQHEKMEAQNQTIEQKNKDILDNFIFARSIQNSILPKESEYQNYLPDSFIMHISKDEISGDFYWIREKCGKIFIAAVDCTGHGVSGALVSMIGFLSLNRALAEIDAPDPAEILNKLDTVFQTEFNHVKADFNVKIGMDIAIVSIDLENHILEFSGAFNPLYLVRKGELTKINAHHYMLGIEVDEFFHKFENTEIEIQHGDSMYLFSDGLADQFGGPRGKKFGYERLRKLLLGNSLQPMEFQKHEIRKAWDEWKGNNEQTDDVLLMGFKL
jgi:serine phosphatase RsbU (regulator of sigma subunit)